MLSLIGKANALFGRIPGDLIAIAARVGIATTFLRSGLLKLDGWSNGNTLTLFTYEYKLPVIPPGSRPIWRRRRVVDAGSDPRRVPHALRRARFARHDAHD